MEGGAGREGRHKRNHVGRAPEDAPPAVQCQQGSACPRVVGLREAQASGCLGIAVGIPVIFSVPRRSTVFEVVPAELERGDLRSHRGRKGLLIFRLSGQLWTVGQGMKGREESLLVTRIVCS